MNDRTVVAWDGTNEAASALDWAVAREKRRDGTLVVVRVLDDSLLEEFGHDATSEALAGAVQSLDDEVARLHRTAPAVHLGSEMVRGDPRSRLEWFATESTVLVVGTRNPSVHRPLFAKSLTPRLIAEARGPVVVVPTSALPVEGPVVVGVDGSDAAVVAAAFAADEAERLGCDLTLLHAWLEPTIVTALGDVPVVFQPWLKSSHQEILDRAAEEVRRTHPGLVVHTVLEQNTAAEALTLLARSASLLVVGARGYGPIRGFVLGSVTSTLLATLPCPVAILGPEVSARTFVITYGHPHHV
jgi:nucleotide-binding universal stress UspA family protein